MSYPSIISPEDQKVTFVELFFDLVFVFSVTQVVGLLHEGIDEATMGRAILVFWLVWWAWTQFTWALNAADTTHHWVQLAVLAATAVAFFMAVAVPDAFHGGALAFALPYLLLRTIGLTLYAWVASSDPSQRAAVRKFAFVSVGGLVAVLLGGLTGGAAQSGFWGLTILLDVVAASVGGRMEGWNLHPEHFAERHGLIVIIALGETLIVAAGGVTRLSWAGNVVPVAVAAVAITCALWWSYFVCAKPELDRALESSRGADRSTMARDVYSLLHFPMLCGVIACAAAIEAAIAHPADPLSFENRVALSVGLALFVGGMAVAIGRATRRVPLPRLVISLGTASGVAAAAGVAPLLSLALSFLGVTMIVAWEHGAGSSRAGAQP